MQLFRSLPGLAALWPSCGRRWRCFAPCGQGPSTPRGPGQGPRGAIAGRFFGFGDQGRWVRGAVGSGCGWQTSPRGPAAGCRSLVPWGRTRCCWRPPRTTGSASGCCGAEPGR